MIKNEKGYEIKTRKERIICPHCNKKQMATVEELPFFDSYYHVCVKCEYVIMESEWNPVKEGESK